MSFCTAASRSGGESVTTCWPRVRYSGVRDGSFSMPGVVKIFSMSSTNARHCTCVAPCTIVFW